MKHWKLQRPHQQKSTITLKKKIRQDLRQWKSRPYQGSCKKQKIQVFYHLHQSLRDTQQSYRDEFDLSQNHTITVDRDHAQQACEKGTKTNRTLLQDNFAMHSSNRSMSSRSEGTLPTAMENKASNTALCAHAR